MSVSAQMAAPSSDMVDGVVAEVNGVSITLRDVMERMRSLVVPDRAPSPSELQALYAVALQGEIQTQLVLQEYAGGNLQLPDWIVEKQVSETIDSQFGGDRTRLLAMLAEHKMTMEEWRKDLEDATILMAMRQMNVDKNVHVGPSQVREYYHAHEAEFTRSAGTRLSLILLKPKAGESEAAFQERVGVVKKRLEAEPFREIARFFSSDASASRGGDWGWIAPDTLRTELAGALVALPVGEVSEPIVTTAGTYFLKNEGVRPEGLQTLESVRDEIVGILRRQESDRLFREWTQRLREKSQVRVLRESL